MMDDREFYKWITAPRGFEGIVCLLYRWFYHFVCKQQEDMILWVEKHRKE